MTPFVPVRVDVLLGALVAAVESGDDRAIRRGGRCWFHRDLRATRSAVVRALRPHRDLRATRSAVVRALRPHLVGFPSRFVRRLSAGVVAGWVPCYWPLESEIRVALLQHFALAGSDRFTEYEAVCHLDGAAEIGVEIGFALSDALSPEGAR